MKTRIIVVALIEKDGTYLFGRKPKDVGPYPNTWVIIGGGINLGEESLEEALKREVKEETGIEIDRIEPLFFDEDFTKDKNGEDIHYIFLDFMTRYKSGDPRPNDDIAELKWFSKEELQTIKHTPPSEKLLKKAGLV